MYKFYINNTEVEEPIGWDAIVFKCNRMETHGIDQVFSTEVQFYGLGAKILKEVYDQYFINAEVYFRIVSDIAVGGTNWSFTGLINFALYQEVNVCDTDSWTISVGIIEDAFREKFKSRMGTDVDLFNTTDLDGSDVPVLDLGNGLIRIRTHSQNLYLAGAARQLATTSLQVGEAMGGEKFSVVPYYWGDSDYKDEFGKSLDVTGLLWSPTNVHFVNTEAYTRTFNLKGNVNFKLKNLNVPPSTFDIRLYADIIIYDETHTQASFVNIGFTGSIAPGAEATFSWPFNQVIVLPEDWSFQIKMYVGSSPPGGDAVAYGELSYLNPDATFFDLTEVNAGSEYGTPCDGLYIYDALKRIIYLLTGDPDGLISDTFNYDPEVNGCYWNNFVTTGLQIRNGVKPNQGVNAQIITSYEKFFANLHAIFCLGWAYERTPDGFKIRVEKLDYFYQNNVAFEATNVGTVTQSAMSDKLINAIKSGYTDKWKNTAISGLFSIHSDRTYSINNKATRDGTTAELDLRSDFIAEGNTIEFLRRLFSLKAEPNSGSSDRPNDYDIFIIWLNRFEIELDNIEGSGYGFQGESGPYTIFPGTVSMNSDLITYSSSPIKRLYNIYHTPARLICRHWKYVGMFTYGLPNPKLSFQAGLYNTDYSSRITGNDDYEPCIEVFGDIELNEGQDITLPILNDWARNYLFRPIEIEFEYPQTLCDYITLSFSHPYEQVMPTSGSFSAIGYIQSVENNPNDENGGTTKFKLIASNIIPGPPEFGPYGDMFSDAYL